MSAPRRKCPVARRAVGGNGCQRKGCTCKTGHHSLICACCLKGHSDLAFTKGSVLKSAVLKARLKDGPIAALIEFEAQMLVEMNARPTKVEKHSSDVRPDAWR